MAVSQFGRPTKGSELVTQTQTQKKTPTTNAERYHLLVCRNLRREAEALMKEARAARVRADLYMNGRLDFVGREFLARYARTTGQATIAAEEILVIAGPVETAEDHAGELEELRAYYAERLSRMIDFAAMGEDVQVEAMVIRRIRSAETRAWSSLRQETEKGDEYLAEARDYLRKAERKLDALEGQKKRARNQSRKDELDGLIEKATEARDHFEAQVELMQGAAEKRIGLRRIVSVDR
jgi:hypothetical protein